MIFKDVEIQSISGFFQGFPTIVKSVESITLLIILWVFNFANFATEKKSQNLKLANQNDPEIKFKPANFNLTYRLQITDKNDQHVI